MLCAHSGGFTVLWVSWISWKLIIVSESVFLFSPVLLPPLWISQFVYARNAKCCKLTVNRGSVNEVHVLYIVYSYPVLTEGIQLVKFRGLYLNLTFHTNDLFCAQEAQLSTRSTVVHKQENVSMLHNNWGIQYPQKPHENGSVHPSFLFVIFHTFKIMWFQQLSNHDRHQ